MRVPLISVFHPTARVVPYPPSLPQGWRHSMQAYFDACDHPERVEYVVSVHQSRWEKFWSSPMSPMVFASPMQPTCAPEEDVIESRHLPLDVPAWGNFKVVRNHDRDNNVDQINCAARHTSAKLMTGTMDDLFPPEHWDSLLLDFAATLKHGLDGEYLVTCQSGSPMDEHNPQAGFMTRALYERWGYVVYPGYESMYCDNDLNERAQMEGVMVKAFHIAFDHRHPIFGKAEVDDVYRDQNAEEKYRRGRELLMRRRANGFKDVAKERVVACCFPGEWFECQSVVGMLNIHAHLLHRGYYVHVAMGHTTNVYCTRIEMAETLLGFTPEPELILWVDDDNIVTREQLDMLIADLDEHPELPGVVGWCWCDNPGDDPEKTWMISCGRQEKEAFGIRRFTREDFESIRAGEVLLPVDWSGFPVVLMRGEALRKLTPAAFNPIVRPDVKFGFTSEDTSFFWNAKQSGLQFAVDIRVKVPHVKWRAIEPQWVPKPVEAMADAAD